MSLNLEVQIKKNISISFILLIFLSLIGSYSQTDLLLNTADTSGASPLLVECTDQVLPEFREPTKINLSGGAKQRSYALLPVTNLFPFLTNYTQCHCFQQKWLSSHPPQKKLFIDFGALII